jgi:ribosomal protein S18 acetylase RimI-like enzyme
VQENNTNAFAFWQHMGFKVFDITEPRKVKDKEFRIYRMRKTL